MLEANTATGTVFNKLLINGTWVPAIHGETFDDINPATGDRLSIIAAAQAADVNVAVQGAKEAFDAGTWSRAEPQVRSRALFRLSHLIRENMDVLALLEAKDVGKLPEDAKGEIGLCADLFEYYAGAIDKVFGESFRPRVDKWAVTLREPVGVVAAIVPWNYPLPLGTLKVAPALAMGNTVVLKPAEEAPLTNLYLGQLAMEAGIPAGVLNIVPGLGNVAGEALIHHPNVNLIAFTGSVEVGKKILRASADHVVKTELELGGKSPQIVFPDADLHAAARGIALGLFKNAGQDCCAGSRIFVHKSIYQEMVDRLVVLARSQKLGDPLQQGVTMGPVISPRQQDRVHSYVEGARNSQAEILTGGEMLSDGMPKGTSFYLPTLIANVSPDMRVFQEEIFGPVGVVVPFDTEEAAVSLANSTRYGLASAIWTNDLGTAHRVAQRLEAGMVWVNEYYSHVMGLPFGGYKQSGIGKDYSLHALDSYSQLKEVTISFPSTAKW